MALSVPGGQVSTHGVVDLPHGLGNVNSVLEMDELERFSDFALSWGQPITNVSSVCRGIPRPA